MATMSSSELLQAKAELWCHSFGYLKSMALHCAVKLGIPNAIHRCGGTASLSDLLAVLPAGSNKRANLARLMRFLTMSGLFAMATKDVYRLTPVSRLLVTDDDNTGPDGHDTSLSPLVLASMTRFQVNAALHLANWFGIETTGEEEEMPESTPFVLADGTDFWGITSRDPEFNRVFNDGMGSDSRFTMELAVRECPEVFAGIGSLIDVGGGNGTAAKAIARAFPHVKCSVLDLPQVISGVGDDEMVEFIAGDMMEYIPPVDAVLLKYVLHDWSDNDCVKILRVCREAIVSDKVLGKVIIVDTVVGSPSNTIYEAQLLLDMAMMVFTTGKERTENEWQKIFTEAGFNSYKILPILGMVSIIELYPNPK
uniref:O-methyltransferase domain-containing protein n=1 Tax=Leersia perrieri TaxID=77586 RepID=A0A0D9V1T6_9ORYZ